MTETEQLADIIALSVHAATEPLLAKIAALEARPVTVATKEAWDILNSAIGDLQVRMSIAEAKGATPGPPGERGPQGERGEMGPKGADGLNGKDGAHGLDGKDGAVGLPGKDGAAGLNGKDGANGLDGKDGRDGIDGKDGADGLHGKDGIGVASALLTKDGALVLTLSDGSVRDLGIVRGEPGRDGLDGKDGAAGLNGSNGRDGMPGVPGRTGEKGLDGLDGKNGSPGLNGKDGKDGKDGLHGKDGLGFDDVDVVFDERKGWLLRFVKGTQQKDFTIPIPFDAKVWEFGKTYPKGAGVTSKGAFWIAQTATSSRPGDSTEWRLAVRGGRDGKPGKDGKDGGS